MCVHHVVSLSIWLDSLLIWAVDLVVVEAAWVCLLRRTSTVMATLMASKCGGCVNLKGIAEVGWAQAVHIDVLHLILAKVTLGGQASNQSLNSFTDSSSL